MRLFIDARRGPRKHGAMKILAAMSGGVDSSVAAAVLVRDGHEVHGVYMKNWINEENIIGHCPWEEDIEDARAVAEQLGLLGTQLGRPLGVLREQDARPREGHAARVVAGEHDREQQAGDLVLAERAAVLVLGLHQRLQHVVTDEAACTTIGDDALDQLGEARARLIVHRELKPENIILARADASDRGRCFVCDARGATLGGWRPR